MDKTQVELDVVKKDIEDMIIYQTLGAIIHGKTK